MALLVSCHGGNAKTYKDARVVLGTVVEITVAGTAEATARRAIQRALGEFQRCDDLLSHAKPESLVSKINRDGSSAMFRAEDDVFELLRQAVEISRASGGAFDVTILPVSDLWEFDRGGRLPKTAEIAAELPRVGYEHLILDESTRSVGLERRGMGLDLGAIAKGWAVDRAMASLAADGVRDAIIDAGGDLRIAGGRPGKGFWRIGIQHPREPGALLASFDLRDTAIVTSGDYERFFMADGVRYHHILDPATGQPARGCQSVTVLAATAAEADACATAAFVLGPEKGLAFLRSRPGVRGLIVDAGGALHWSDPALEGMARR